MTFAGISSPARQQWHGFPVFWLGSMLGGSVTEMPAKVVILAQFDDGYYIRGTLKRLMSVLPWLKAWWIYVTDQKSTPLLPRQRGNARKSCDFGSVWPRILYPWGFEEADRCCGLAPGLVDLFWPWILYPWDFEEAGRCFGLAPGFVDLCERETGHRPDIHATVASPERKCSQKL
ncbi:hypothetical protein C8R44DRAFT_751644 [Mycena epipterygia]|nr:hypothetical protein C8R44DRAFT_751644 [Mycena epipterygia]